MTVAEKHNIQSDIMPGIASGFCGGMYRTDGLCDALVGDDNRNTCLGGNFFDSQGRTDSGIAAAYDEITLHFFPSVIQPAYFPGAST